MDGRMDEAQIFVTKTNDVQVVVSKALPGIGTTDVRISKHVHNGTSDVPNCSVESGRFSVKAMSFVEWEHFKALVDEAWKRFSDVAKEQP